MSASDPAVASGRFLATAAPGRGGAPTLVIVGVPYDGAVSYRSGASSGPAGIRAASDSIESYCPRFDRDLAEFAIEDHGDVDVDAPAVAGKTPGRAFVDHVATQLRVHGDRPILALGGDHLCAYPFLMRALRRHPDLQILHVDAHTDLRDQWDGDPFNHATVLGRVVDDMPATASLWTWGIRSGLREEFTRAHDDRRIVALPLDPQAATQAAEPLFAATRPLYVTLDVDGIDPSEIPGTGTPEPGGLRFREVETLLVALARARIAPEAAPIVGADLVELAPSLDPSGITAVAGARLARTLALCIACTGARATRSG